MYIEIKKDHHWRGSLYKSKIYYLFRKINTILTIEARTDNSMFTYFRLFMFVSF